MLRNKVTNIEEYKGKNEIILINDLKELSKITFKAKIRYNLKEESDIKILKQFKSKDSFIELIIPNEFEDVKLFTFADRLIFNNPKDLQKLFSECILHDIYPLTKGIPMCHTQIQHTFELFNKQGSKEEVCKECIYKTHCSYNKNYNPIPKKEDKEFEEFIKNENPTNRI